MIRAAIIPITILLPATLNLVIWNVPALLMSVRSRYLLIRACHDLIKPINCPAQMRNCYRPADNQRDVERVHKLSASYTFSRALLEVIGDTVVTTQDSRGNKPHQFFGAFVERAIFICLRVKRKKALDSEMIAAKQTLVHVSPVTIEFVHRLSFRRITRKGLQRTSSKVDFICLGIGRAKLALPYKQ